MVERVICGAPPFFSEGQAHPDTGEQLVGIMLEGWPDVAKLCLKAATFLPRLRLQHWDVAMTSKGPVILELNTYGWLDLPQLASGRGLYDGEFQAFHARVRERNFARKRLARRRLFLKA